MSRIMKYCPALLSVGFLVGAAAPNEASAQPAPIPRAIVPADQAPEALTAEISGLVAGENPISIEGAEWLQLRFSDFQLGENGTLVVTGSDGETQTFTQEDLEAWSGRTAIFNGAELTVTLTPGESAPGVPEGITAQIGEIVIGLPGQGDPSSLEAAVPSPLRQLLGEDFERFIADDEAVRQPDEEGATLAPDGAIETLCGADDRVASNHPFIGRIMPIGCTGWLIGGGAILTAGHCIAASTQTVEFNVPPSQSDRTTVSPPVQHQYPVNAGSIVSVNGGIGNDWAIFRVNPNSNTGLLPHSAQGGSFALSNTANPAQVRITGYGVDDGAANQTQQTHAGALTENSTAGAASATLRYTADTMGGNSGGPVIVEGGGDVAIGIHTNGGCTGTGGANAGTSFRNQTVWNAIAAAQPSTADIVWQHWSGQVHYWPMTNGQRQGGINIFSPVGPDWRLAGIGDVDGSGTEDIIWQHWSGQVHYWPMANGQRQGGINIFSPVGPDWRLAGAGDVNGDGTDDIVWQHWRGQVHFWPMLNGQRQGGTNIHTPVGPDWELASVGDVNGDGTDDIVWQHWQGQTHYWPMANGQRQGGINIFSPVGPDWRLAGAGDVNGDGTDDIVWQHFSGQVHYWPMLNGQRQGGINIHTPVGPDWKLAGVGDVD